MFMTDTEKGKFSGYHDVIRQLINNAEVAFVKDPGMLVAMGVGCT